MPHRIVHHTIRRSALGAAFFCAALGSTPALSQETGPDALSETYRDWVVACRTTTQQSGEAGARLCEMTQELRRQEGGQRVLLVALRPEEDAGTGFITLITPFGIRVTEQVQITVDDAPVVKAPFQTCLPQGCIVQTRLDQAAIEAMRQGEAAIINLPTTSGEQFQITVSLLGFTAAWNRLSDL